MDLGEGTESGGNVHAREMKIRRALRKNSERLTKLRLSEQDAETYGPYMIVDMRGNSIVAHGLSLEEVEATVKNRRANV